MDPVTAPEAGVLLETNGLRPITEAPGITQSGGEQTVLDGPFTESGEVVGGYCILQVESQEEAVEWTSRFLTAHGPGWDIDVEVRRIDEPA
ncbi:YciI family protein [Nocardia gipuzkoensis]|uniref:YciI family protein n=1 Tax=Nocardia gipuzkoensis TaxID=2749991 RepID=UPI001E626EAC|nr:YciI family protein [Nocardia gipuzkoensis]UGT68520.1 YciI family protein [Nocardia gipuzkoensis]